MEIKMFLLTTARVERSRVGRNALKLQPKALKHRVKLRRKALKHRVKLRRKVLRLRVKALKPSNQQPKPLQRLLGRLTSASPTR